MSEENKNKEKTGISFPKKIEDNQRILPEIQIITKSDPLNVEKKVSSWDKEKVQKWIENLEEYYQLQKGVWYDKIKNDITSGAFLLNITTDFLIESSISKFHSNIIVGEINNLVKGKPKNVIQR
jgi:hypothetical protein